MKKIIVLILSIFTLTSCRSKIICSKEEVASNINVSTKVTVLFEKSIIKSMNVQKIQKFSKNDEAAEMFKYSNILLDSVENRTCFNAKAIQKENKIIIDYSTNEKDIQNKNCLKEKTSNEQKTFIISMENDGYKCEKQ